jgi:hypothetical protein
MLLSELASNTTALNHIQSYRWILRCHVSQSNKPDLKEASDALKVRILERNGGNDKVASVEAREMQQPRGSRKWSIRYVDIDLV